MSKKAAKKTVAKKTVAKAGTRNVQPKQPLDFYAEAAKLKVGKRLAPVTIKQKVTIPVTATVEVILGFEGGQYVIWTTLGEHEAAIKKALAADLKQVESQYRKGIADLKKLIKKHGTKEVSWQKLTAR